MDFQHTILSNKQATATMNAQQIKDFKTALRIIKNINCPSDTATADDWDDYQMIYDNAQNIVWEHANEVMKGREWDLKLAMQAYATECDQAWNGTRFVDIAEMEDEDRDRFCGDCGKAFVEHITCFKQNWYSTKCGTCTGQAFTCEVCNEEKEWKEHKYQEGDEYEWGERTEICKQCAEDAVEDTHCDRCRVVIEKPAEQQNFCWGCVEAMNDA
jgi:hypothetical protein